MRFVRTEHAPLGLIVEGSEGLDFVVDVAASLSMFDGVQSGLGESIADGRDWGTLIDRWDATQSGLEAFIEWAVPAIAAEKCVCEPLQDARLLPPVPASDVRIFAVGANFAPHAARAEGAISGDDSGVAARTAELLEAKRAGVPPWGFNVLPHTLIGPDATMVPPAVAAKVDYEGEVAVVLRRSGEGRRPTVWGVTAWNDFSVRDPHFGLGRRIDQGPLTWSLQKNFDTANACGPWLVVGEPFDVDRLGIELRVNGDLRQQGNTSEMIYSFTDIIEHVSPFLAWRSGDMIASGTPSGTAFEQGVDGPYLEHGDEVVVTVEGVGTLRNVVERREMPGDVVGS